MTATKTTLENGLTVILKEMHHAPVVCCMVWYRVGSRNEVPGMTGISHWVEHMMFKGTLTFPNGEMDRLISREGGYNNAYTWLDYTAYFETLPSSQLDLALRIEADRMVNTVMKVAEVEAERAVILAEREMYENDPDFLLNEELISMAFRVHPYHHEIIGDLPDLRMMTRDDLFGYYRRFYVPNNAVLVVVGDFETAVILPHLTRLFGSLPSGQPAAPITRFEPAQKGERRLVLHGTDQTAQLLIGYRAPAATHPDYFALALLNAAFTGGSGLGEFGGGGSGKSSRLYRALVDSGLALSASGNLTPTIDPFLYMITVIVQTGQSVEVVEAALEAELARLATEPLTQDELDRAKKRAKVDFMVAGESMTGQAELLGLAEAVVGDYGWMETILERLTVVTLLDIERVRATYLQKRTRTVGWYLPEEDEVNG